jgi:hypothetical protein
MKEKETMKIMKAKTLDRIFDENEKDILDCFDN